MSFPLLAKEGQQSDAAESSSSSSSKDLTIALSEMNGSLNKAQN
jgi:hypothetical protein